MGNSFLKKLILNEVIILTTPSDEISLSYLLKSKKSLLSSKTLFEINHFDDATALIYYSMYYCVLALLFKCGIKSENHTGSILLIKLFFTLDTSLIELAKKERIEKQYYVDESSTKEDVQNGIESAQEFNALIQEKIQTMNQNEITRVRGLF